MIWVEGVGRGCWGWRRVEGIGVDSHREIDRYIDGLIDILMTTTKEK